MTDADALLRSAIRWKVILLSGQATGEQMNRFQAWRTASPAHEAAWQQVEAGLAGELSALRPIVQRHPAQGDAIRLALGQKTSRRQWMLAVAGAGIATLSWSLWRDRSVETVLASASTNVGERRHMALPDGSQLELDARSDIDMQFGDTRRLHLRQGRIFASVEPAAGDFLVDAGLQIRVPASRSAEFLLTCQAQTMTAACMKGSVLLQTEGEIRQLHAGDGWRLPRQGNAPQRLRAAQIRAAGAWRRGLVEALDEPLQDVIEQMCGYFPGTIVLSQRAARLRVQGVWPLADVPAALRSMASVLPLKIHRGTDQTLSIDAT